MNLNVGYKWYLYVLYICFHYIFIQSNQLWYFVTSKQFAPNLKINIYQLFDILANYIRVFFCYDNYFREWMKLKLVKFVSFHSRIWSWVLSLSLKGLSFPKEIYIYIYIRQKQKFIVIIRWFYFFTLVIWSFNKVYEFLKIENKIIKIN